MCLEGGGKAEGGGRGGEERGKHRAGVLSSMLPWNQRPKANWKLEMPSLSPKWPQVIGEQRGARQH